MSWNLVIYKTSGMPQQVVPLGDLDRVTDALNGAFINLEWESRTSASLPVENGFRVNLTLQGRTVHDIHTDGGFNHLREFAGLCKREGWRMADAQEGEDVDLGDPQRWYRERNGASHHGTTRHTSLHGKTPARATARRFGRTSKWVIGLLVVVALGILAFYLWRLLGT